MQTRRIVPYASVDCDHAWVYDDNIVVPGSGSQISARDLLGNIHLGINNTSSSSVRTYPRQAFFGAFANLSTFYVSPSVELLVSPAFTFSIWIRRLGGLSSTYQPVAAHHTTTNVGGNWYLYFHSDNKLHVDLPYTFGDFIPTTTAITDSRWHHVVLTRKGSSGNWDWSIYLDGRLEGSVAAYANNPQAGASFAFSIGMSTATHSVQSFKDAVHWSRYMGAAEVQSLYSYQGSGAFSVAAAMPRVFRGLIKGVGSGSATSATMNAQAQAAFTPRFRAGITAAATAPATFTAKARQSFTAAAGAAAAFTLRPRLGATMAAGAAAGFTAAVGTQFTLSAAAAALLAQDGTFAQGYLVAATAPATFSAKVPANITAAAAAAAAFVTAPSAHLTAAAGAAALYTAKARTAASMAAGAAAAFHGVYLVGLRPASIESGEDWGTPNVAGPVNPASIESAESWGTPTLNVSQEIAAGGIASTEDWGTPRVSNVETVSPGTIASGEDWGSPVLSQNNAPVFPASIESAESWGAPDVGGGRETLQIFVGNYDRSAWLNAVGGITLRQQSLGRWSATAIFRNLPALANGVVDMDALDTDREFVPAYRMTVLIKEYERTLFRGCIRTFKAESHPTTNCVIYTCELADKGALCDDRRLRKSYPAASEPEAVQWDIADVIRDIHANYLNGEGITLDVDLPASLGLLSSPLQAFISVTQAWDQIRDMLGYAGWFVDKSQVLRFVEISGVEDAPFDFLEDGLEWRNVSVRIDDRDYRNSQIITSNRKVIPGGESGTPETYALLRWGDRPNAALQPSPYNDNGGYQQAAFDRGFPPYYFFTTLGIERVVSATLNGVAVTVIKSDEMTFDQWDEFRSGTSRVWVYDGGGSPTIQFPSRFADPYTPLQAAGDVVVINYVPAADGAASAVEDPSYIVEEPVSPLPGEQFGTCGSGRVEHVEQVNDVFTNEAGNALARGLLDRSGFVAKFAEYETHYPGFQVGQRQYADAPRRLLDNEFLFITDLTGTMVEGTDLGHRSSFNWKVTACNRPNVGNWLKTWERLYRRTQHPTPVPRIQPTVVILGVGRDVRNGEEIVPGLVNESARLAEVIGVTTDPPTDQDLVVDIFLDGVSIFNSAKFIFAAGVTTNTQPQGLRVSPLYGYKNQVVTASAHYRVTGPNPVAARNCTITLRWDV